MLRSVVLTPVMLMDTWLSVSFFEPTWKTLPAAAVLAETVNVIPFNSAEEYAVPRTKLIFNTSKLITLLASTRLIAWIAVVAELDIVMSSPTWAMVYVPVAALFTVSDVKPVRLSVRVSPAVATADTEKTVSRVEPVTVIVIPKFAKVAVVPVSAPV
jgi:hypothetical protein